MIKFIWIVGNVGAGKTTLCNALKPLLQPKWTFFNIDEERFAKNTEKSLLIEEELRRDFVNRMKSIKKFSLLESVGTYGVIALDRFDIEREVLIIKLKANSEVLMSRLQERLDNPSLQVPFPYIKNDEASYQKSIQSFNEKMKIVKENESINVNEKNQEEVLKEVVCILKKYKVIK